MISKGKIAALSAVGLAVVLIAGGYGVSVARLNPSLDRAEVKLADYINAELDLSEREAVSIDFFETTDSGLFSRKYNLVLASKKATFQVPVDVKVNYLSYAFSADLKNAMLDGQKVFEAYRDDLKNLTLLDLYGSTHIISGKSNVVFNVKSLNDMQAASMLVSSAQDRESYQQDANAFAKSKGFGDTSELYVSVGFNRSQDIKISGKISEVLSSDLALRSLSFNSTSKGIGDSLQDLGAFKMVGSDAYVVKYGEVNSVEHFVAESQATPFDQQGNFDMSLHIQAQNINGQIRELIFDTKAKDFNYPGMLAVGDQIFYQPESVLRYLKTYPFELTVEPSSKVVYIDASSGQDVIFNISGLTKTVDTKAIEGNLKIETEADLSQSAELQLLQDAFETKENKSVSEVKYTLPLDFKKRPRVLLNDLPIF